MSCGMRKLTLKDGKFWLDGTHYTCPFCKRKYYYDDVDQKIKSL